MEDSKPDLLGLWVLGVLGVLGGGGVRGTDGK